MRLRKHISDVTEYTQTEKQISHSLQDWENIINSISDAITIHDMDFNIIFANSAAQHMLNLPSIETSKIKCYIFYHGGKRPPKNCASCRSLKTKKPSTVEMFEPFINKYLEIKAIPRINSRNQIIGLIHIVRDITKSKKAERELIKSREDLIAQADSLMEANIAIKVLLKQREMDRAELGNKVFTNIKILIMPYIEKLKQTNVTPESLNYISILESNMNSIISSSALKVTSNQFGLTPKEIQISSLIRDGQQSKDIASILNISFETVNCHRQNIRKKFGLGNSKTNLRSFLLALSE